MKGSSSQPTWLLAVVVWQLIVAAAALVIAVAMTVGALFDLSGIGLVLAVAVAVGVGMASAYSIPRLLQHRNRGRAAATLLDYVLIVLAGFAALQVMGIFRGLDALAENFRQSVYWLLLVIVGWVIYTQADRFRSREQTIKTVGRWIMLAGVAILALASGLIPGVVEFVRRLVEPDASFSPQSR